MERLKGRVVLNISLSYSGNMSDSKPEDFSSILNGDA